MYLCTANNGIQTCQINDQSIIDLQTNVASGSNGTVNVLLFVSSSMPYAGYVTTNFSIGSDQVISSSVSSGTESDSNPSNNLVIAGAYTKIIADLQISVIQGSLDPVPGCPISYIFSVLNNGPSDAHNCSINIVLPPFYTFNTSSSSLSCLVTGSLLSCGFGNLQYGVPFTQQLEILLTLNPNYPDKTSVVTNWTISSSPTDVDPIPANNFFVDIRTSSKQADVTLALSPSGRSSSSTVDAGCTWNVPTIVLSSKGPSSATGLALVIDLNANVLTQDAMSFISASGTTSCTGNSGVVVCIPKVQTLLANEQISVDLALAIGSSVPSGTGRIQLLFKTCSTFPHLLKTSSRHSRLSLCR